MYFLPKFSKSSFILSIILVFIASNFIFSKSVWLSTFFSGFSRVAASELPGSVFLLGCEAMAPAVAPTAKDRRGIAHCFLIRGPT